MKVISSEANQGGLSLIMHHCFFNGVESITHYVHDFDTDLYKNLPNLYVICISDNSGKHRQIKAGFSLKTSYTHNDSEFLNVIFNTINSAVPALSQFCDKNYSFLPAKLSISDLQFTEDDFVKIMVQQYMKFNIDGTA